MLRAHLPADDPLAGYADRLEDPDLRGSVRGYLTGSIDLVVRVGEAFAIADYKTNWLAAPGEELQRGITARRRSAAEMEHAHYGLQALLYTAALHRYLRWRLRGYDPERHLAGVLYLFVRGMTGPTRRRSTERPAASSPGARPRRSSSRSVTSWTGGTA